MASDFLTLMLTNMTAGLVILAAFILKGLDTPRQRNWAPALAATGLVALVTGLYMSLTWPLTQIATPGGIVNLRWANMAYGEPSVLLGTTYLAAAVAVGLNWRLGPVTLYGAICGLLACVIGVGIWRLGLPSQAAVTGIGFLLTGLSAVAVMVAVRWSASRGARILAAVLLLLAAGVWLTVTARALWAHLSHLSGMIPPPS